MPCRRKRQPGTGCAHVSGMEKEGLARTCSDGSAAALGVIELGCKLLLAFQVLPRASPV